MGKRRSLPALKILQLRFGERQLLLGRLLCFLVAPGKPVQGIEYRQSSGVAADVGVPDGIALQVEIRMRKGMQNHAEFQSTIGAKIKVSALGNAQGQGIEPVA